ncbi:MAG: DUF4349 domain-containing protein [Spirochaetaceae bacterium]
MRGPRMLAAVAVFLCLGGFLGTAVPHAVAQDGGPGAGVGDAGGPDVSPPGVAAAGEDFLALEARARLLVSDREDAAQALITWTEDQGGYFVERSLERVVLRIPSERFAELRSVAGAAAEEVITYNPSAQDLREELSGVEAAIVSREENLERVLAFLEESDDVEGTLALEREIASLMLHLESLRGRARALRTRVAYARAEIALSAQAAGIPDAPPSSFDWLNSLDLYDFLSEARQ